MSVPVSKDLIEEGQKAMKIREERRRKSSESTRKEQNTTYESFIDSFVSTSKLSELASFP